jgi:homopolymeric O-antigen transport system permease protein
MGRDALVRNRHVLVSGQGDGSATASSRKCDAPGAGLNIYADIVRYRELFANLFRRDLKAKYKGSVLGVAWSLANPLALMAIYLLVFSFLWRAVDLPHYPLYLLSGLAVWIFFSTSLQAGARSLLDNADLIKKVRFPRQLVPLSLVATQLVSFAVMIPALIVVDAIVIPEARDTVWLALPIAALIVVLVAGVALTIASLNVLYRDVEHLLQALLLPWFFLTPIVYSYSLAAFERHETVVQILRWGNFVTPPIEALRAPLYEGRLPRLGDAIYLVVAAAVSLVVGAFVFSRVDDRIPVEL